MALGPRPRPRASRHRRTHDASSARLAARVLLVLWAVAASGCQDMIEGLKRLVEHLVMLALVGFGLATLGVLGMLGMSISAFRARPPRARLVLSTGLAGVSVAATLLAVHQVDTLGFIEVVFGVLATPAILWALITWGEVLDLRRSRGNPNGNVYRTLGLLATLFYVACVMAFVWNDHGRPSWESMRPRNVAVVEAVPLGEPIVELHLRSSPAVALTKSGRMLLIEGSLATVHPGTFASVVAAEGARPCGVTAERDVSCFGSDAPLDDVASFAISATHVCAAVGPSPLTCKAADGSGVVTITDDRSRAAVALEGRRLFVLGKDHVVLEFDVATGQRGSLRVERVASVFTGGDAVCFAGTDGSLRCQRRSELRPVTVPFAVTAGAVTGYVGCVLGAAGQVACWDEFSRAGEANLVNLDAKVDRLDPGNTFYVTARLSPDRFVRVDGDLDVEPITLPTGVYSP